ncbi:transposase [Streptomyces sp. NPDC060028]|uniref:transposase n=1 Tax=Streptomyces sp. NPDC060028 TaxID=3347041 RepID=UPI0036C7B20F
MARFTKSQGRPCPVRTRCTTTADSARTVGFPPRELRDLQLRIRAEQQTPAWKARYAVRSGMEGTTNEFAADTACATAATQDSRKPTCSTYSRRSP